LQTIEQWGVLNTDQVQALLFKDMAYGQRKAQDRLLYLHRTGKLQRKMVAGSYCYYLDPKGLLKHRIGVNWIRLWTEQRLPDWEKIHSWSYEQDYKTLRCDGFAAVKNKLTGTFRFSFIEMDRGTNAFDKVMKYNKLYIEEKYTSWWWVKLATRFPPVEVVTVTPTRKQSIQSEIERANEHGIEFKVVLLDDIRKEVMNRCLVPTIKVQE
jgi:hypothetical protein